MFGEKTIASILVIMLGNPPGEEATTPEQPQVERRAPAPRNAARVRTSTNQYMDDTDLTEHRKRRKRRETRSQEDIKAARQARRARREARLKEHFARVDAENARRDN